MLTLLKDNLEAVKVLLGGVVFVVLQTASFAWFLSNLSSDVAYLKEDVKELERAQEENFKLILDSLKNEK